MHTQGMKYKLKCLHEIFQDGTNNQTMWKGEKNEQTTQS